jgi:peptide/nickel transport system permease protein
MLEAEAPTATLDPAHPAIAESAKGGLSPAVEGSFRTAWRRFRRHRPGLFGLGVLVLLYVLAIFADFIAPYDFENEDRSLPWAAPSLRFFDDAGFSSRPFVHPLRLTIDSDFNEIREEDKSIRLYVRFFNAGDAHKLLGILQMKAHLFALDPVPPDLVTQGYQGRLYLMGADSAGRDIFSRICYGSRISMSIGLVGSLFVLIIGLTLGGSMGYFGGRVDDLLYSFSQMVSLLPGFYLLLMLRFMFPQNMDSREVYFAVVLILSLIGWPGFAIIIRGMVKSIMAMDYVLAARALGLGHGRIIARHVLPNTTGYVVVATTLRIPAYILGEAALSVLGLGITEPTPSWGNMLDKARDIVELNQHPWVLWPGMFIFLAVIAFNLVGDGLRDALDPRRLKT